MQLIGLLLASTVTESAVSSGFSGSEGLNPRNFVSFIQKNVQTGGQSKGTSCVPLAVDSHSLRPQSSVSNSNRTAGAVRRNPEC
jgi:hypothetical protein